MLRRVDHSHAARQRRERPAQHDALDQRPQRAGVALVGRVDVRPHLLGGGRRALCPEGHAAPERLRRARLRQQLRRRAQRAACLARADGRRAVEGAHAHVRGVARVGLARRAALGGRRAVAEAGRVHERRPAFCAHELHRRLVERAWLGLGLG